MAKTNKLTQAKLEELQKEYDWLTTVRTKEVTEMIKEARSFGDLSENSEYDEAKNEQGRVHARIEELTGILSNYEIIDTDIGDHVVRVGNRVKVVREQDGKEMEFTIVGSTEANPSKKQLSDESPFGKAVLGKTEGDKFQVEAPIGVMVYTLVEVGY